MSYLGSLKATLADGPNLDAFSRLRVSSPAPLHEGQFTYNLLPYRFEALTNGSGAAVSHDTTNRCALFTLASSPTGSYAGMQTYEFFRYQPGRSQAVFITFGMVESLDNVVKYAGYSDGTNGIEFQVTGATPIASFNILSGTTLGNQQVTQANWNLDKLDGTGKSGKTLDISRAQILVIDLQALYVGRVRCGFDIGGEIVYCHEFNHANRIASTYIQYASLPIRAGMRCAGTVSTTMRFICSSVMSEGGTVDFQGFPASQDVSATAGNETWTHILSLRPKTTFGGFVNRSPMSLYSLEGLVTGASPIEYRIVAGQAITGTTGFTSVGTKSSFEYNTAGTISGAADLIIESGFIAASNTVKGQISTKTFQRVPITLDAAGNQRLNGTISLIVKGIAGASACQFAVNWLELR